MNTDRRSTLMACLLLPLLPAACSSGYEEAPGDKEAKSKLVGFWYRTQEWLSRGVVFHFLTERKEDGTWERKIRVHPMPGEKWAVENVTDAGRWGVNFGRYVEKKLVEDSEPVGQGRREVSYFINFPATDVLELKRVGMVHETLTERRVAASFQLP